MKKLLFLLIAIATAQAASAQPTFAVHNVTNDELTYSTAGMEPVTAPRDILAWTSPHNLERTALDLHLLPYAPDPTTIAAPPFAADSLAEAMDSLDVMVRGLLRIEEEQSATIANQSETITNLQSQVNDLQASIEPLRSRVDSLRAEQSYALGVVRSVIRLMQERQ